jgi:hypothetical protein
VADRENILPKKLQRKPKEKAINARVSVYTNMAVQQTSLHTSLPSIQTSQRKLLPKSDSGRVSIFQFLRATMLDTAMLLNACDQFPHRRHNCL